MVKRKTYKFRLYIAGDTMNSVQARTNLHALCSSYLAGQYEIEVVDVFREQKRALEDGIFMTPTLLKLAPSVSKVVGTLSNAQSVLIALGIDTDKP